MVELIKGRMRQKLLEKEILHTDETTLQVLKEHERAQVCIPGSLVFDLSQIATCAQEAF